MRKMRNERWLCWLCLAIVLLMSPFLICETSPLYQKPNEDNAIFLSMGKAIVDGKTPYVDVTENKGPLFFMLISAAQLFVEGTVGVYVLETLMLLAYCWLIMKIARWLLAPAKSSLLVLLPVMWCVWRYMGRNFCEEYDRFFTLIGLAVMVRVYTGRTKGENAYAFVLGLCTAAVILIKMSDVITLGVTTLFYLYHVIRTRRNVWKEMLRYLCGMLTLAVPVTVWLVSLGAFGAMLQEYFVSNIVHVAVGKGVGFWESRMYIITHGYGKRSIVPMVMMAAALLVSGSLKPAHARNAGEKGLHLYAAAVALSTLMIAYVSGSGFRQHLMLGQLTEMLAILLVLRTAVQLLEQKGWLSQVTRYDTPAAVLAAVVFMAAWSSSQVSDDFIWTPGAQAERAYLMELQEDVADSESVYGIGIPTQWFWYNDIIPAYRYYNLRGFIEDNVGVGLAEEFEAWLMENPVETWAIFGEIEDYRGILTDDTIEFMHSNYEYYSECSAGDIKLLRLI